MFPFWVTGACLLYEQYLCIWCRHPECDFSAGKDDVARHENKCLLRLVPCPVLYCAKEVQFSVLIDHLKHCKIGGINGIGMPTQEIEMTKKSHYSETTTISAGDFESADDLEQSNFKILVLGRKKFIPRFVRNKKEYYAWMQMIGGHEKTEKFLVTITVGRGTHTGITHRGIVFPIDVKHDSLSFDCIETRSGLVSFSSIGMGHAMFRDAPDGEKEITVHYEITHINKSTSPGRLNLLESKWQPTHSLTGSNRLRTAKYPNSDSDSDEQGRVSSDSDSD